MNLLTVLLLAGSLAGLCAAQDAPAAGSVTGTVINGATGAGVSGASVALAGNKAARYDTTSDAAGQFRITGVAPGTYRPTAQKEGFATGAPNLSDLLNSAVRIASDSVKVEIRLWPLSTIQGRVFDADGKPIAGIEVSPSPNIGDDVALTDGEGRFELEKLRPGSYTLIARPPESAKPAELPDGTRIALLPTYFPSVADRSQAQQIVLGGSGNFAGTYEIRMQSAAVHRVRGIVLDQEGKPSPATQLTLFPVNAGLPEPMGLSMRGGGHSLFALGLRKGPAGPPEAIAVTGAEGQFEFPAVRPGDWSIDAEAPGPSRGTSSVRTGRADVEDIEIRIAKPFALTGTVEWKDPIPASPPLFGTMILVNPDGNEIVRSGIVQSGEVTFESVAPGRYKLIVAPGLTAQVFLGDNEVTGAFPVLAGGPRLRVVLKTWSGSVRGTVEKGEGATVVLVPQQADGVAVGQTVVCGAGGSFEMKEVSPGDYDIAAFEHWNSISPDAALLSLIPGRGKSVKVAENSTSDVALTTIPASR